MPEWLAIIRHNSVLEWLTRQRARMAQYSSVYISVPEWLSIKVHISVPEWLAIIRHNSVLEWLTRQRARMAQYSSVYISVPEYYNIVHIGSL